ncbi:zinc finger domain-containing protein [Euryarchaeota archaeon]|nr:zinc finger domain-containing protein [Euryarchaeota archaeon]
MGNHQKGVAVRRLVRCLIVVKTATICNASGKPLVERDSTSFPCPKCNTPVGRSAQCRNQGVPYICVSCGFQGP